MEQTNKEHQAAHSPALTAHGEQDLMSEVTEAQQRGDSLQPRTGMTPSDHDSFHPWIPFPLDQPVIPETPAFTYNERRLDPLEWVELLQHTECLDYVSPDVDECIERQGRMEGNQELDLTGREFIDSPMIPKLLPPLNTLSAERPTILRPINRPQRNAPRRPGLREQFPRQQPRTEQSQAHFPRNYLVVDENLTEVKRSTRRNNSSAKSGKADSLPRSASRSLKFEAPHKPKPTIRHKRASWSGRSARAASTPASDRRQCKSARKSKECMIPGCSKGARSRGLCKRHGGGKRCTNPECTRSDQGGGYCIAHGGGKRCATEGCKNSAQSRGLCKTHGGGKRCRADGCTKSSQGGGYCRGHGAGRASTLAKSTDIII
ncbi:hypothetical protein PF008_g3064 [Phytophthora fragariae]|uniref:WRKY19-like zinc finger domain-containing protein n=1 Tax=Phytophthora fragariae TaxID=53985 RepID=A0A6G0SFH9_9STRA|nr:hypothetical protein PF008_g3064 [Phytophthora fragariae]